MSIVIGKWQGMLGGVLALRELEGVLHCANDCTVKEASKAMGISPETLKKRLASARYKLKVTSIRALVLEAFRLGLIAAASCAAPADPDPQHHQDQDSHDGVFLA